MHHISHHAARTPDKPVLIMAASGRRLTYGELNERSCQTAHLLRSLGLKKGDSIALAMENSLEMVEICQAAARSGLYYTALSTRLTAGEAEYIINDCNARVFFLSAQLRDMAAGLEGKMPKIEARFVIDGEMGSYLSYEEARGAQPKTPIADEAPGLDMLYSSGTTGRPKGIRRALPVESLGEESPQFISVLDLLYQINSETRYLSPAPLYHAAPLRFVSGTMRMGGTVVVMEKFDPEDALKAIAKHKITHSQWVPTMFVRMLKLPQEVRAAYDISSLRCAIHAAAPCPVEVKKRMIKWWGEVIYEYYAGTEGNGFCGISSPEWLTHEGSVGRAITGILHICDEEGKELPAGEEGTIYFENETQFEYHNDPSKTKDSRHPVHDDWSTLGDIGRMDEEGYLYLTDRKAHMIISGGVTVSPQEAENILVMHEKVADVAVIGVPNEDFGEEVKAVVQPVDWRDAGEALGEELMDLCRQHLSPIKCPRSVDFAKELPRHATGKLYKRLLRDKYWAGHESKLV